MFEPKNENNCWSTILLSIEHSVTNTKIRIRNSINAGHLIFTILLYGEHINKKFSFLPLHKRSQQQRWYRLVLLENIWFGLVKVNTDIIGKISASRKQLPKSAQLSGCKLAEGSLPAFCILFKGYLIPFCNISKRYLSPFSKCPKVNGVPHAIPV
jgi:hypothetical protein